MLTAKANCANVEAMYFVCSGGRETATDGMMMEDLIPGRLAK